MATNKGYAVMLCAVLLLLFSGIFLGTADAQQNESDSGVYELEGHCNEDIQYFITGGALHSLTTNLDVMTMTVQISSANGEELGADRDGTLVLTLPESIFPFEEELFAFVDGEDGMLKMLNSTKDYLSFSVDFPEQTHEIEIVGDMIPSYSPYRRTLDVNAEGKSLLVFWDGAPVCSWSFDKEAKKITVHSDNATRFMITIPHELLGPPYSAILDGKNYQNVAVQTGSGMHNRNYTTISATFSNGNVSMVNDIEIIGTTVIPEFGSAAILVTAGAIVGGFLLLRFRIK